MNKRHTIQKDLVLSTVMGMSCHPTAEEVFAQVSQLYPSISKATVYRNLNLLADEGTILRVAVANAPDRYDKTSHMHCHFMCRNCGKVYDYTLAQDIVIDERLNPGFVVNGYELVVNGRCAQCCG